MKTFRLTNYLFIMLIALISEGTLAIAPLAKDDFYNHVNGAWIDHANAQMRFYSVDNEVDEYIKNKVTNECDSDMVREMYKSLSASNKKRSISIELNKINAINKDQIPEIAAYLRKIGVTAFMDIGVKLNANDRAIPIITADISLTHPEPEDVIDAFTTAGEKLADSDEEAERIADRIVIMQTEINELPIGNGLPIGHYRLAELSNEKRWGGYFKVLWGDDSKNIDVYVEGVYSNYLDELNKIINKFTIQDWKIYFKFRFLNVYSVLLLPPTQKDMIDIFGSDLNRLCFERYIESNREKLLEIVGNVKSAYADEITTSTVWDDNDKTKTRAKLKLSKITLLFEDGTGEVNYSTAKIDPQDPIGNVMNIRRLQYQYTHDMFGNIQNSKEFMLKQDGNLWKQGLVYDIYQNKILIPISWMIPPRFYPKGEDAVNYGGFGASVGHEISHAYDIDGIKYNELGNIENWITGKDEANFAIKSKEISDQYKLYHAEKTVVEDTADILGLLTAYNAYQFTLKGKPLPPIINQTRGEQQIKTTGNQRFYYSFAEIWRSNKPFVSTTHSPNVVRVNTALRNQLGFREAFDVKAGDGMYTANPISVW